MSTVQEIEEAIQKLTPEQMSELRTWFAELDAHQWDAQFEADVLAGKLDRLADQALEDYRNGRFREL